MYTSTKIFIVKDANVKLYFKENDLFFDKMSLYRQVSYCVGKYVNSVRWDVYLLIFGVLRSKKNA